jgi:hypothetical protein
MFRIIKNHPQERSLAKAIIYSQKTGIMSFKAKLKIAGKELDVLACSYKFHQETDSTGRPSSVTRGGQINLTWSPRRKPTFLNGCVTASNARMEASCSTKVKRKEY